MSGLSIKNTYPIPGRKDLSEAGVASSSVKRTLNKLGVSPDVVKKTSIAMYEAEINAVIHADGGEAQVEIDENKIVINIVDNGPGIADIPLAMTAGYSTASDSVREMGFGAGMGLPNIKKYADEMHINTNVGSGTTITLIIYIKRS